MASLWFPEAGDVSGNEEGIRACHDPLTPAAFITCQDCSSYLTFGCHSLHPNYGIREGNIELSEYYIKWEKIGPDLPDRNKIPDPFNLNPI